MTFEARLRTYRKQLGLSQEKMAEAIHVSRQAVTKWESGAGTPDLSNLKALSDLFGISIDELLSGEKTAHASKEFLYESKTSYDIDQRKDFDIHLGGVYRVAIIAEASEKIKVNLLSNSLENLSEVFKVKIDDIKNRIDIHLNRLDDMTEAAAKEGLTILVVLPQKYLGRIELAAHSKQLDLVNLCSDRFEFSGKVSDIIIDGGSGEVELDSNLDLSVTVHSHQGAIALNQFSATSKICVPADYSFQTIKKGFGTRISFEEDGQKTDDFSAEDAENTIELNGLKSELIISKSGKEQL
ncbi:helix-turn-helix domain-containing protein [Streptococcus dentiloxodontae]